MLYVVQRKIGRWSPHRVARSLKVEVKGSTASCNYRCIVLDRRAKILHNLNNITPAFGWSQTHIHLGICYGSDYVRGT